MPQLDPRLYTVAWIAPLEIEARAALLMLDRRHEGRFSVSTGDDYVFLPGDVCGHNVIVATLPAGQEYGTGSSAALASQVKKFFPNLWFGLLVGVAAGLPDLARRPPRDIRLGDVLVALPEGESAALVAYDLGKETGPAGGFQLLRSGHVLATTEAVVRSAIGSIKLHAPDEAELFLKHYLAIRDKGHATGTFVDPGQEQDRLYEAGDEGLWMEVERPPRPGSERTQVWYGPIGSGDKLMKDGQKRNELRDRFGLIGLEMDASPWNKIWQPYAAAMAAAYAKAILSEIPDKIPPPPGGGTDGPVFHGPISGRNVVAGVVSTSGGTTNLSFS